MVKFETLKFRPGSSRERSDSVLYFGKSPKKSPALQHSACRATWSEYRRERQGEGEEINNVASKRRGAKQKGPVTALTFLVQ